jgi:hypothetical protein
MGKEVSFGDESLVTKVVPKFRFMPGEKSVKKRILFISQKLIKDTIHVIEHNGFIKCLVNDDGTGECPACNAGNFKKARYATHVLEYVTDANGRTSSPFSYAVKAFAFAKGTAEKLQNLHQNMGDSFQKLDVVVACENPEFQLINFTPVIDAKGSTFSQQPEADKTRYREDIIKQVSEINLSEVIARVVTPETMIDMLSGKIKTFTPKKEAEAAPAAATSAPATTAAQAALPLTAPVPAPAATVVTEATPAQKGADKMMEELAI